MNSSYSALGDMSPKPNQSARKNVLVYCLKEKKMLQIMKCPRCPYISIKYIFEKKVNKSYRRGKMYFLSKEEKRSNKICWLGICKNYNAVIWNYSGKALFIVISACSFLCFPGFPRPSMVYLPTLISICLLHICLGGKWQWEKCLKLYVTFLSSKVSPPIVKCDMPHILFVKICPLLTLFFLTLSLLVFQAWQCMPLDLASTCHWILKEKKGKLLLLLQFRRWKGFSGSEEALKRW